MGHCPPLSRFTIAEQPVNLPWSGDGSFEDGGTEDYLLEIPISGGGMTAPASTFALLALWVVLAVMALVIVAAALVLKKRTV
jgi:hypothetical protein